MGPLLRAAVMPLPVAYDRQVLIHQSSFPSSIYPQRDYRAYAMIQLQLFSPHIQLLRSKGNHEQKGIRTRSNSPNHFPMDGQGTADAGVNSDSNVNRRNAEAHIEVENRSLEVISEVLL